MQQQHQMPAAVPMPPMPITRGQEDTRAVLKAGRVFQRELGAILTRARVVEAHDRWEGHEAARIDRAMGKAHGAFFELFETREQATAWLDAFEEGYWEGFTEGHRRSC
jgi:hypothetical protein